MKLSAPEPLLPTTFIFGEPVLQKYYTTFDKGNLRVGFGLAKHAKPREGRRPTIMTEGPGIAV